MKNVLKYKGYYGSIEYSEDDLTFYGKLEFIRALVSYEGESAKKIKKAFESAVDDYLALCQQENVEAEKPFKGSFNVRIGRELHERAIITALANNISLNEFIKVALNHELENYAEQSNLRAD
jgi:predicted HicB family RNase H-like nuclease